MQYTVQIDNNIRALLLSHNYRYFFSNCKMVIRRVLSVKEVNRFFCSSQKRLHFGAVFQQGIDCLVSIVNSASHITSGFDNNARSSN